MSLFSERRREVEIVLAFILGIVLVSVGSFLWLFSPLSNEVKSWGRGMYWLGFASLVEGVFLAVKGVKLVVVLFLVLGVVLAFFGLYWSDFFQTEVYNPLTLAALGILLATGLMIIELWFGGYQTEV